MQQIAAIQALRAVAALAVVFGHAQSEALAIAARNGAPFATIALNVTGAGVDLFFVISGFVMVHASRGLFGSLSGPGVFIARRVARIVPLYWCATAVYLAVMFASPSLLSSDVPTPAEIIQSYFFVPYLHEGATLMQPVYKLGWTLNYEMFFYVIFAGCLVLPMRNAVIALTLCFGGLAAAALLSAFPHSLLSFWGHPIVLEFVAGAWLALGYARGIRLGVPMSLCLIGVSLAGLAVSARIGIEEGTLWRPVLLGLPAALLFAACILRDRPLAVPAYLAALGDASYALYLIHPIVIRALRRIWDRLPPDHVPHPWIFVAICGVISVCASIAVYKLFERPVTQAMQRILLPARGAVPAMVKSAA